MRTALFLGLVLLAGCATPGSVHSGSGGDAPFNGWGDTGAGAGVPVSTGAGAQPPTGETTGSGGAGGRPDTSTGAGGESTGAGAGGASTGGGVTSGSVASAASSASSASSTSGGGGGTPGPTCTGGAPPSDPKCYWEAVCPDASLADLAQAFDGGNWLSTSLEMTKRRYPSARCLIQEYASDVGNYVDASSFAALAESLMTMVHEETHGYDYDHAGVDTFSYYARCDLATITPRIDGFPRSEILSAVQGNATNLYDGTYLTGDQGTYGFTEVLDEWNAYLNGMAGIGLVGDYVDDTISGTDGALALAYYTELYLKVARTKHPDVYAQIKGDATTVAFLRQQWNRMHFFLALAQTHPNLSIEASAIQQNLYADENRTELEQVIGVPLTPTSCN